MKCVLAILLIIGSAICKPSVDLCKEREVYKSCGTACPATCTNYELLKSGKLNCLDVCKTGCFCEDGLVRDETTQQCIPYNECPVKTTTDNVCADDNEVYDDCGTACPETCTNYELIRSGKVVCPDVCKAGCFCKKGLVRDDATKKCVATTECPTNPKIMSDNVCTDENEEFKECGTACPETCSNFELIRSGKILCPAVCKSGCFCKNGLVRDANGVCVPTSKCLKDKSECNGEHEVFNSCGSDCPKTCDNFDKTTICDDVCKVGCFCQEPYVRDIKTGRCVVTDDCIVKPIHD